MACLHLIKSVSQCEPERSTSHLREVSLTEPRLERRGLNPAGCAWYETITELELMGCLHSGTARHCKWM